MRNALSLNRNSIEILLLGRRISERGRSISVPGKLNYCTKEVEFMYLDCGIPADEK
jgi:hypothetical protein